MCIVSWAGRSVSALLPNMFCFMYRINVQVHKYRLSNKLSLYTIWFLIDFCFCSYNWMPTGLSRDVYSSKPLPESVLTNYHQRGIGQSTEGNFLILQGILILDIDGLVQDCSNSIAKALELLQSCTKPLIWAWKLQWRPFIARFIIANIL